MTTCRMVKRMPSYLDIMTIYDCLVWSAYGYEFFIDNGHVVAIEKDRSSAKQPDLE